MTRDDIQRAAAVLPARERAELTEHLIDTLRLEATLRREWLEELATLHHELEDDPLEDLPPVFEGVEWPDDGLPGEAPFEWS